MTWGDLVKLEDINLWRQYPERNQCAGVAGVTLREGSSVQFTWTEQMRSQVPSGHLQPSRDGGQPSWGRRVAACLPRGCSAEAGGLWQPVWVTRGHKRWHWKMSWQWSFWKCLFLPALLLPCAGEGEPGHWWGWKWVAGCAGDGASPGSVTRKLFQCSILLDGRKGRRRVCVASPCSDAYGHLGWMMGAGAFLLSQLWMPYLWCLCHKWQSWYSLLQQLSFIWS